MKSSLGKYRVHQYIHLDDDKRGILLGERSRCPIAIPIPTMFAAQVVDGPMDPWEKTYHHIILSAFQCDF